MLTLTPQELDDALAAIKHHGHGDFFPEPPELSVVEENWREIRDELARVDLDTYEGYDVMFAFAPKSRVNVRRVALLHPYDLVFYTALVLSVRGGIGSSQVREEGRIFSYRSDGVADGVLYRDEPNYRTFREKIIAQVESTSPYVGVADIADFYARIYQHRLVNALEAACGSTRHDQIRALGKMLVRFSENVSYGIPIGPPASRPLGEALLIDVDSALLSFGVDFVRFTDDYVLFAESPDDVEFGIRVLGETLFLHHGLTLQTAKTKITPGTEYVQKFLQPHTDKEEERRKLIEMVGEYDESVSYEDMDEGQRREIDAMNLSGMLTDALAEGHNVDFREVSFILGRLSALEKPELIPIVLNNLERLTPVAHSVAAFFRKFGQMDTALRQEAATKLLEPILRGSKYASEYYAIWILSIFSRDMVWNHADTLLRIFRETPSDVVRRFAALALAVSGTRAQAIHVKQYFSSASSLSRTAMMLATSKMGRDERKYLRQSLRLHDSLEKLCMQSG